MRIIDSHFHWWPKGIFEQPCKRSGYPRAERNSRDGYNYLGHEGRPAVNSWAEWFDLDRQLDHMDGLGHEVSVVCSPGPFSIYFSDPTPEEGQDAAMMWNERERAGLNVGRGVALDLAVGFFSRAELCDGAHFACNPGGLGREARLPNKSARTAEAQRPIAGGWSTNRNKLPVRRSVPGSCRREMQDHSGQSTWCTFGRRAQAA
jgi:hypothetical protein